jgi:hypothetical protein
MMLKIIFFLNIILIYFQIKNILKNNYNHPPNTRKPIYKNWCSLEAIYYACCH